MYKKFNTVEHTYTFDGKIIESEYRIVGSVDDFSIASNGRNGAVLKWNAEGKYNYQYCYVIPPLTEFEIDISGIESISFDDNCREVYFADGCYPVYDMVGGNKVEKIYVSASVTFIESLGCASTIYSVDCVMARSPQVIDNKNVTELVYPDNIYEIYNVMELKNLVKVSLPANLHNIMSSFIDCDKLEQIDIPYLFIEGIYASFINCPLLKDVNITFGVKVIHDSFINCPMLEYVYIPEHTLISEESFTNPYPLSRTF